MATDAPFDEPSEDFNRYLEFRARWIEYEAAVLLEAARRFSTQWELQGTEAIDRAFRLLEPTSDTSGTQLEREYIDEYIIKFCHPAEWVDDPSGVPVPHETSGIRLGHSAVHHFAAPILDLLFGKEQAVFPLPPPFSLTLEEWFRQWNAALRGVDTAFRSAETKLHAREWAALEDRQTGIVEANPTTSRPEQQLNEFRSMDRSGSSPSRAGTAEVAALWGQPTSLSYSVRHRSR